MTNAELKEYIREQICDDDIANEIILLEGDEFADGFIGLTTDSYQAVYSYERLITSLVEHNGWSTLDAAEWLDFNTRRSIPYMPLRPPIIIHEHFTV